MSKNAIKLITHDGIQELVIVNEGIGRPDSELGRVVITKSLARWLVRALSERII